MPSVLTDFIAHQILQFHAVLELVGPRTNIIGIKILQNSEITSDHRMCDGPAVLDLTNASHFESAPRKKS